MKNFDLSALDTVGACDTPMKYEFKHPTSKVGLGFGVYLLGSDSKIFHDWVARDKNASRLREFELQRKKKDVEPLTHEDDEARSVDLITACTTGFWCAPIAADTFKGIEAREGGDGFFWDAEGKKYLFTEANVRKFYTDMPEALRQANKEIGDLENFIKP